MSASLLSLPSLSPVSPDSAETELEFNHLEEEGERKEKSKSELFDPAVVVVER